jgi:hypothetical protein
MLRWHVVQIQPGYDKSAYDFMRALEFEPFIPMIARRRSVRGRIIDDEVSRFGCYIFGRFDAICDPWGHLSHSKAKRSGIVRVLCNAEMKPSPVPDAAIEAIRAYRPILEEPRLTHIYQPGESCICYIAGIRKEAVFVKYEHNRQFVRTWMFGCEHLVEVRAAELEPLSLDNSTALAASAGK